VDLAPLKDLNGEKGAKNEIENALLVWHAMSDLTPSLACENRIWTRLTHLEGLIFSRERWLKSTTDDDIVKVVRDHFFANTRTKWRDDNALSRLWWIAYIASQVSAIDQKTVLQFILEKADIRSNFVERPWVSSRPKLAAGIIRVMMKDKWITEKEANYRSFMKQINKYGGGILFETWNDADLDSFIINCASLARADS
jgi:type I site-specific restriction endonuclease